MLWLTLTTVSNNYTNIRNTNNIRKMFWRWHQKNRQTISWISRHYLPSISVQTTMLTWSSPCLILFTKYISRKETIFFNVHYWVKELSAFNQLGSNQKLYSKFYTYVIDLNEKLEVQLKKQLQCAKTKNKYTAHHAFQAPPR